MDLFEKPRARMTELRAIRQAAAQEHEKRHHRFGYLRLALGAMLAYAGWLALAHPDETPWPFLIQLALFMSATMIHSRVVRHMEFAQRSVDYYDRGLARLNGDYSKTPSRGESFSDPHHPFSGDLDLFGTGGLFERLCHARTREGESTLASWLLKQDGPPAAPARLAAASELADRVELREALAVLGPDLKSALHPEALRQWSTDQSKLFPAATKWLWITASFSIVCVVASIALQALSPIGLGILLSSAVFGLFHKTILQALHETSHAGRDLKVLQEALALIEQNAFESDLLKEIQSRISAGRPTEARPQGSPNGPRRAAQNDESLRRTPATLHTEPRPQGSGSSPTRHPDFQQSGSSPTRIPEAAVLGDGKLGLLIGQVLLANGIAVHHFGRHKDKLAIVKMRGAIIGKSIPRARFNVVIDATGSSDGLATAIAMCRPRGTVVMKSTVHDKLAIDMASVIVPEITLLGSRCGRFQPALDLLANKQIDVLGMLHGEFPLKQAPSAFESAAGRGVLKVLLRNQ